MIIKISFFNLTSTTYKATGRPASNCYTPVECQLCRHLLKGHEQISQFETTLKFQLTYDGNFPITLWQDNPAGNMRNLILVLLNSIFCMFAFATDLSAGAGEFNTGAAPTQEYVAEDGNCPTLLKKWVDDDFTDQSSFFFPFPSEAKTCQTAVRGYQDYLNSTKRSPGLAGASSLGSHLSQKYKDQVHTSYQERFLKDCKTLSPEKATAIQTRFYAASSRIAAVNSPIIDEVSYYDSLLPNMPGILSGVDCTPMFPDNNKKCAEFKTQAQSCAANKQERFDDMVARTKKNLIMIEDLKRAHRTCTQAIVGISGRAYTAEEKAGVKTCDAFLQVIELKKNETPWIRGEIFSNLAIKEKANPRNKFEIQYDFSNKSIDKAMTDQLTANRKALTDTYNTNLENFRCLSGSMKNNGEPCDFKQIRTDLSVLPQLDQKDYATKNQTDRETTSYLEAERCLLDRGEDRAKTQAIIDSSGKGIALTIATLGIGSIASGGVRAINAASKVGRTATISNGLLNGALTTDDLKKTYESCSKETKMVNSLSGKSEVTAENICSDPKSPLAQARQKESDCLVSALLSVPGLLPFAGALPSLARMVNRNPAAEKAELNAFIANMSGRDNLRKQDLDFAGSLNKEDRITAAEGILGRSLSPKEKDAILEAHLKGGPVSFNGSYAPEEIAEKRDVMRRAGFSERESEILLWKGITGSGRDEMLAQAQKRATDFFGKPISSSQTEAIVSDYGSRASIADRTKNLTDAGFTPKQAAEIMDSNFHSATSMSSTHPTKVPVNTPRVEPKPVAAPPAPPAPLNYNPFVQSAAHQGAATPDALRRVASGHNITPTEARMGLEEFGRNNKISGGNQKEVQYKSMLSIAEKTFKDADDVKKALASPRLTPAERKSLEATYDSIKSKCKSLASLASLAGLDGSSMQEGLKSGASKHCN